MSSSERELSAREKIETFSKVGYEFVNFGRDDNLFLYVYLVNGKASPSALVLMYCWSAFNHPKSTPGEAFSSISS